jgi:glycosyltransferase involved in cell wall biosynthesis
VSTRGGEPRNAAAPKVGTVHLVYPHGPMIATPDAIGRNLGKRLEAGYTVVYHDWTDRDEIHPEPGDVLLGHPHPSSSTVFRRSSRHSGWRRVILLAPFSTDLAQVAFLDSVIRDCDVFLALTGPYWFDRLDGSVCSHWKPKMIRLDLAIDRRDYPPIKRSFNEPGHRRFLYIGHTGWWKNIPYLAELAKRLPGVEFAWMGSGDRDIASVQALGPQDFRTKASRDLVARYDFMLTVGSHDANPTTILEAMAWGLIPVCTPQSGYHNIPSILNVPLGQADKAAQLLLELEELPADDLMEIQRRNWDLLKAHYTWDRFAGQVVEAIESPLSLQLGHESLGRRIRFIGSEWASPTGPGRRRTSRAIRRLRQVMRSRIKR